MIYMIITVSTRLSKKNKKTLKKKYANEEADIKKYVPLLSDL